MESRRQRGLTAEHLNSGREVHCSPFTIYYSPLTMFQVRAAFSEQVEWRTSVEAAREFFNDLKNFAELMPGVERITADAQGIARWLIRAEVPVVGAIRQAFAVSKTLDEPARIEWGPAAGESKNFLRYTASFEERG